MSKILVVEDEVDIRENLELLLTAEGYEVLSAEDGLKALKVLEQNSPELIISDIMMPFMDGIELYQTVRENVKTKIIPFIFLTAKNDPFSIRKGMNLGADDYITKPFLSEDILTAIRIRLEKYNSYNKQIEKVMKNISKYVPHEFRTPLVTIIGYSDLISCEMDSLSEIEVVEMVDRINFSAKRLHNRIEKFIQFTDTDSLKTKKKEGAEESCSFENGLIKEIISKNYLAAERTNDFIILIGSCKIGIPENYMKLLLNELIENAVKFSEPGEIIDIKGEENPEYYIIEITDHGIGINEKDLNILGTFKQVDRETKQQIGNGLGLAIVNNILKSFNGEININSKENEFTTITLNLPKNNY